jgi:hypothetical protein
MIRSLPLSLSGKAQTLPDLPLNFAVEYLFHPEVRQALILDSGGSICLKYQQPVFTRPVQWLAIRIQPSYRMPMHCSDFVHTNSVLVVFRTQS